MRPGETPPTDTFHALLVSSNELGVLIPSYDSEFMHTLTDLYDCKAYSESRRGRDIKIEMERTFLNIFAACTPGYLRDNVPPGAWDQGFLSRTILVHLSEQQPRSLFAEEENDSTLVGELKRQLKKIGTLYGKAAFSDEAKIFIDHWNMNGQEPLPSHHRLLNYNSRRVAHLLKLTTIAMVADFSTDLVIQRRHIERGMEWLFSAEAEMPEIFKSMNMGGDGAIIEDAWYWLYQTYMREGKEAVASNRLMHYLLTKVPAAQIPAFIRAMSDGGMIREETDWKKGGKAFIPIKVQY